MYEEAHIAQTVGPRLQKIYTTLWKLPTLPRIQQFLWKEVFNLIPTKEALGYVVVGDNNLCPLCDQHTESVEHFFMSCAVSGLVWFAVAGWSDNSQLSLTDWICSWFDSLHNRHITIQEVVKRSTIVWCIWTARCDKVFQNKNFNPETTIQRCKSVIKEHAQRKPIIPRNDFNKAGGIGLSSVIMHVNNKEQGLWEAVKWAKEPKMEKVQFELDANLVVEAVNKDNSSIDGRLLNYIKDIKLFVFQFLVLGNVTTFLEREIKLHTSYPRKLGRMR
ncbi:uncharacterized protein LOC113311660 [Papaver somniferum]|uniref:uncharacterized protein LOC113311660 n=1 Tax=Papaver somniferum TaxID=3469 RepID=UPI000E70596C|nr:uncharacterized protein LOC113311660 [Papaver somniferum]